MTTIIPTPHNRQRIDAIFLRSHLRMLAAGMSSRASKTMILAKAGQITGTKYKRGQFKLAADELTKWLEAQK